MTMFAPPGAAPRQDERGGGRAHKTLQPVAAARCVPPSSFCQASSLRPHAKTRISLSSGAAWRRRCSATSFAVAGARERGVAAPPRRNEKKQWRSRLRLITVVPQTTDIISCTARITVFEATKKPTVACLATRLIKKSPTRVAATRAAAAAPRLSSVWCVPAPSQGDATSR